MKNLKFVFIALIITGCNDNQYNKDMNDFYRMYGSENDQAGVLIDKVSAHKLYFGHQSVGFNILSGIEQWEEESGINLEIAESRDFTSTGSASLVHFRVGQNGYPKSKIDDFVSLMESVPEDTGSAAFFKLCYVDITTDTNVDEVFDYYKEKMYFLKDSYSYCQIILFTVPVTAVQTGLKAAAKRILGRESFGVLENIKRNEFNERLLNEMEGDFPIFDLAGVETTLPDGSIHTYTHNGTEYPSMPDMYTSDGGHLNDYGAKIVSFNLLAFLSETLK